MQELTEKSQNTSLYYRINYSSLKYTADVL